MSARTVFDLQADLLAAYQAHTDARTATHAARVKVSEAQKKESAAADAVAVAEKALSAALESNPLE